MKQYLQKSLDFTIAKMPAQVSPNIPRKLYLDLTEDCNMFCSMCRDEPGPKGRIMERKLFERIINETKDGVSSYSIFNWGESLLVPDIKERIEYIHKKKRPETKLDISTNGMLLTEEMADFLLKNDVEITVSFDGATKETFEKIRRGSNFEIILKNLKKAVEISKKYKVEKVRQPGIYVSIQKDNWKELIQIVELMKENDVEKIGMGIVVGPEEFRKEVDKEFVREIENAINLAEKYNMVVDLYPTKIKEYVFAGNKYVKKDKYLVDTKCDAPFTNVSIKWNGDVYLCCNVGDFVENIKDKSFQEIWQGEKYNDLRKKVNDKNNYPEMCKDCPWVNRY